MPRDKVNLWLDDIRPAPTGWMHARNVDEAKLILQIHEVQDCSLDHDLGACFDCLRGLTPDQWLAEHEYQSMPNCTHFGTGYELVLWMAETGNWPRFRPMVHSMNPVGADRMRGVIERYFPDETARSA